MKNCFPIVIIILILFTSCQQEEEIPVISQWEIYEIHLESNQNFENPYTDVELYAEFTDEDGETLRRPGFWYSENKWKIRFAPTKANKHYTWKTFSSGEVSGLHGATGSFESKPYEGENALLQKGFLTMSPGKRNVIHQDGTPFLVVGDTPWALPFRGTPYSVRKYAKDRSDKGFNAALLMSVQPDQNAEGPDNRREDLGYCRAFYDIKDGHLNKMNPGYFKDLDSLLLILHQHEIVPVLQPVFQGFGWKGKNALGRTADPEEYKRYTKYLLARYGAIPVMYLVSADGNGKEPAIEVTGKMLEEWDCYNQPRGIHYSPADDYVPTWHNGEPEDFYLHHNRSFQEASWLDFQWAQTGHDGEHLLHKVEIMFQNKPTKAVANGEPTYERMGNMEKATGWWQGHEAWSQLTSGGTMGVVYGAAGLWNWKLRSEEPGFDDWSTTNASWDEAIRFEGSQYPGLLGKALKGYDLADMAIGHELTDGHKLLYKAGKFYLSYLPEGGSITINSLQIGLPVRYLNPKTGETLDQGKVESESQTFQMPDENPWVLLIGEKQG
ncbi:apiosidase-like domain-containing protein [Pararhodonellum marinum]|uniref:apiosidase-like domain-containing protein n=1 Tax=Pararhodonellum marinum TaxID=2755358 RepID=UPI0018908257|nr:DUF4038 domain-containing protein [Pararhodonellum marinum]